METVVVWMNASGEEVARIAIDDIITKHKVLSGRRIACISFYGTELLIYDDDAGNAPKRESVSGLVNLLAANDILYGFAEGKTYQWSLEPFERIHSESVSPRYYDKMTMATNGTIYFINDSIIYQLDTESGEVRVMMEPVGTCLGDANYYISGFAALPDNIFVLLAKSVWGEEGNSVAIYHEMDIQNRMPFIITSVNYNFLLETAASEFQKLHPEIKVEVNNLVKKATLEQLNVDDLIRIIMAWKINKKKRH